jgi:hypothetical protein
MSDLTLESLARRVEALEKVIAMKAPDQSRKEWIETGPISRAPVCWQRRFSKSRSNKRRRVVERIPPFINDYWAVEHNRIKNHHLCVATRATDREHRSDVIPPLSPPV